MRWRAGRRFRLEGLHRLVGHQEGRRRLAGFERSFDQAIYPGHVISDPGSFGACLLERQIKGNGFGEFKGSI